MEMGGRRWTAARLAVWAGEVDARHERLNGAQDRYLRILTRRRAEGQGPPAFEGQAEENESSKK